MDQNDFVSLQRVLAADFEEINQALKVNDSQFNRRTFVRTVFALIEALIWDVKQVALRLARKDLPGILGKQSFNDAELGFLSDQFYDLNEHGDVVLKSNAKISLERNIKFMFRIYAKVVAVDFKPNFCDAGWEALKKAIKVRDRITHPKSAENMEITTAEISQTTWGLMWFLGNFQNLQADLEKSLDDIAEKIRLQKESNQATTES